MRLSLLSKASSSPPRKTTTTSAAARLGRPAVCSLAHIFPAALFCLSSTVQVQCFASAPSFTTSPRFAVQSSNTFLQTPRGGGGILGHRALFSTAEKTSSDTATTSSNAAMTPAEKLQALRARMKELGLHVYLVPSDDPHLSGKRLL